MESFPTRFRIAIENGNFQEAKCLLNQKADINTVGKDAFQTALYLDKFQALKFFTENGFDIHFNNDFALRWAVMNANFEAVKYLVERGAKIETESILDAVMSGNERIVEYLFYTSRKKITTQILCEATRYSDLKILKFLKNAPGANIKNPAILLAAINNGNIEAVKYLVNAGSIPQNDRPLRLAVVNGSLELVQYFVEELKLEPNIDYNGLAPAISRGYLEIIKFLHQRGTKLEQQHLERSIVVGNFELVEYICENERGLQLEKALLLAKGVRQHKIAQYLEDIGNPLSKFLKKLRRIQDEKTSENPCYICLEHSPVIVFSCGHKRTCAGCSLIVLRQGKVCPLCKEEIVSATRVWE